MGPVGARSPEELETLFEDALLLHDAAAIGELFDPRAVLIAQDGRREAHGRADIVRAVVGLWPGERSYVAEARRVVQARDVALLAGGGAIHVIRRGRDRSWRYTISLLGDDPALRGASAV